MLVVPVLMTMTMAVALISITGSSSREIRVKCTQSILKRTVVDKGWNKFGNKLT